MFWWKEPDDPIEVATARGICRNETQGEVCYLDFKNTTSCGIFLGFYCIFHRILSFKQSTNLRYTNVQCLVLFQCKVKFQKFISFLNKIPQKFSFLLTFPPPHDNSYRIPLPATHSQGTNVKMPNMQLIVLVAATLIAGGTEVRDNSKSAHSPLE